MFLNTFHRISFSISDVVKNYREIMVLKTLQLEIFIYLFLVFTIGIPDPDPDLCFFSLS